MAQLLRVPLDDFNLRFPREQLQHLLQEGVALIGDGLIDLVKPDSQPDTKCVRGLAGTLIAARDYKVRHTEALLVSVDSELARLWLRLGGGPVRMLGARPLSEAAVRRYPAPVRHPVVPPLAAIKRWTPARPLLTPWRFIFAPCLPASTRPSAPPARGSR